VAPVSIALGHNRGMSGLHELHVLRVFCKENGQAGNLLGVFPGRVAVPREDRQAIAARLGFSETVFIEDLDAGRLAIFTPSMELPFAGHPLVGAAWLLKQRGSSLSALRPAAGEVPVRDHDGLTGVRVRPEYSPPWEHLHLPGVSELLGLDGSPGGLGHLQVWAWQDQRRGVIRARVFASDYGVAEDPATGSAAVALCAELDRPLRIIQGPAGAESEIYVEPADDGRIDLGGRVLVDRPPRPYRAATA
jgi:predicted PhzF superfamily epimerase YddE/YHI9